MLLKYASDEKYIDTILNRISNIKNEEYYCQMEIAWLCAEIAIYNKIKVDNFIRTLSVSIQKMYQRKIKDSLRI